MKLLDYKELLTLTGGLMCVAAGYFFKEYYDVCTMIGAFSLSGSVTNWLAVYMLFNRIPFLYGSGVVLEEFESIKRAVAEVLMDEFFSEKRIEKFIKSGVIEASFGDYLDRDALKESIKNKVTNAVNKITRGLLGKRALSSVIEAILATFKPEILISVVLTSLPVSTCARAISSKIRSVILNRLDELDERDICTLAQELMRQHLGWLVVWGGVFGALLGYITFLLI